MLSQNLVLMLGLSWFRRCRNHRWTFRTSQSSCLDRPSKCLESGDWNKQETLWVNVIISQIILHCIVEFMQAFTFMHLADAFIQSDLQCIQVKHFLFGQYMCSLGIEPTTFFAANAMLYHWATGTLYLFATPPPPPPSNSYFHIFCIIWQFKLNWKLHF